MNDESRRNPWAPNIHAKALKVLNIFIFNSGKKQAAEAAILVDNPGRWSFQFFLQIDFLTLSTHQRKFLWKHYWNSFERKNQIQNLVREKTREGLKKTHQLHTWINWSQNFMITHRKPLKLLLRLNESQNTTSSNTSTMNIIRWQNNLLWILLLHT